MVSPAPLAQVRLVATDLDGTLLDPDGRVHPRTAAAVRAARAAGVHVVPVTGRPPQALWHITEAAGLGPLGVCCNGAAIVDVDQQALLQVDPLAGETAARLVDLIRAAEPDVRLACDDMNVFTYEERFFEAAIEWDEVIREVPDLRAVVAEHGCVKLIGRVPGVSATGLIARLEREIADEGYVTTSGLDWVDIGAPGVSKALAVERVCGLLGVGVDDVIAIGDNHNDLSVLAWAGQAMAPANAVTEVRAVATRLLPSNAEGCVAVLLEELVAARQAAT